MEESQRLEEERREEEAMAKEGGENSGEKAEGVAEYLERIKAANMEKLETLDKLNAMETNVRQTTQENQDLKLELETLKKMGVELEDSSDEEEEEEEEEGLEESGDEGV